MAALFGTVFGRVSLTKASLFVQNGSQIRFYRQNKRIFRVIKSNIVSRLKEDPSTTSSVYSQRKRPLFEVVTQANSSLTANTDKSDETLKDNHTKQKDEEDQLDQANQRHEEYQPDQTKRQTDESKLSIEPLWLRKAKMLERQQQEQTSQEQQEQDQRQARRAARRLQLFQAKKTEIMETELKQERKKWRWKRDEFGKQLGHLTMDEVLQLLRAENAQKIVVIDLSPQMTTWAKYMIIAEGFSNRHIGAIADMLVEELKGRKLPEIRNNPYIEGRDTDWMVIHTGNVVVELFLPDARAYYDLESLWTNMDTDVWLGEEVEAGL